MRTIADSHIALMVRITVAVINSRQIAVIPQTKTVIKDSPNALLDACDVIEQTYNKDKQFRYTFLTAAWDDETKYIQENIKRWWTDSDVLTTLLAWKRLREEAQNATK